MFVDAVTTTGSTTLSNNTWSNRDFKESFHDILKRSLDSKSNSRPPRIELSGVLMPCYLKQGGQIFTFKLGTKDDEYLLSMTSSLAKIAKGREWEDVIVKGFLSLETKVIEVEKIILKQSEDAAHLPAGFRESIFDVDNYVRTIEQRGKIEPALEYLAS